MIGQDADGIHDSELRTDQGVQVGDSLSVGLGLSYFSGSIDVMGGGYLVDQYPETFWDTNSFLPERLFVTSSFAVDSSDWGFNVGVLWRFTERWSFGGVYRQGPEFSYELANRAGPAHWEPEGSDLGSVSGESISFPDTYGLGVSYRSPGGSLTVGFEWDRVEYSVILESLTSSQVDPTDVSLDDANELHLGCEYVFLDSTPLIAVRAGLWHDPDHRFRYEGSDPFQRALFPPGQDALHLANGVGVALRHFQIDLGIDFSEFVDTVSLSAIYSF